MQPKSKQQVIEDMATTTIEETIRTIVAEKKALPGALLPILHEIQHQFTYIPQLALAIIAKSLHQTEAEIYGVITFYKHFHLKPTGSHVIEICRGEACQAMGSMALEQTVKSQLGIDFGETTADKNFSLEPVYCLGNCACSPSIKVADKTYGRMTSDKFAKLTKDLLVYKIALAEEN